MDPVIPTNSDLEFWRAIVLATLTENDSIDVAIKNADRAVFIMRRRQAQGITGTVAGVIEKASQEKTP